jgi:hypothetical protein
MDAVTLLLRNPTDRSPHAARSSPRLRDDGSALGESDESPQAIDQLRPLICGQAWARGIDQSCQLLTAGPALPDFVGPHGDLRGRARTSGALVDDLMSELNNLIERGSVRS